MGVDQAIGDVGRLVGYSMANDRVAVIPEPFDVTLVWQAVKGSDTAYTVFVQLLDAEGRLIAQSDAEPAQGQRPTTGWRSGEYIVDTHTLQFNDIAAPGTAHLIVGPV